MLGDREASSPPTIRHLLLSARHPLSAIAPFTLVSDADSDICERYGVWVEKKNYGKTYMGIERSTFLIDADGTISRVWRKVKVAGHVDAVLGAVKDLNAGDG